jgi:hypothetical protein
MADYKYQTNTSLLMEGELGFDTATSQLLTKDGSGNTVVLSNAQDQSMSVGHVAQSYAKDVMDISSTKTLGAGYIFLNGSSNDSLGGGNYEFEEPNGQVFGLYGRTNGPTQQVFMSGAFDNQQDLAFSTVTYSPPWLSGSVWVPAAVVGGDLQGFTLVLADSSNATLTYRYVYVRHNGSLSTVSGHTYVEITPMVNNYASLITLEAGTLFKVVRVGTCFFITTQSWQQGLVWIGGWNAQDSTYPFSSAALPASPATYTPPQFTIQTVSWPNTGGISTAATFPGVMGHAAPAGYTDLFRLYNMQTGAVSIPTGTNWPWPPTSAWINTALPYLDGEVDTSGNYYIALGSKGEVLDTVNQAPFQIVYSLSVQFTGSAGSYTNAQLTYTTPGTGGVDLYHVQPAPFHIGYNANYVLPDETVQSNGATPSTCVNKLPLTVGFDGIDQVYISNGMNINWYYSGYGSVSFVGSNQFFRATQKLMSGSNLGSLAAAQVNKVATLWPMFNVNPRFKVGNNTGCKQMSTAVVMPSAKLASVLHGMYVQPDLLLANGYDAHNNFIWVGSSLPAGSVITDTNYNRNGVLTPGMRARVGEVSLSTSSDLSNNVNDMHTMINVWSANNGTSPANIKNMALRVLTDTLSSSYGSVISPNSQSIRLGTWSVTGGLMVPPPVAWTSDANLSSQLAAVKATVATAALAQWPDTYSTAYNIEVIPVLNFTEDGVAFALGRVEFVNGSNAWQTVFFTTPAAVTAGVFSLTNTASVTLINRGTTTTSGLYLGNTGNDQWFGRAHIVWLSTTQALIHWSSASGIISTGDLTRFALIAVVNNAGAATSSNTWGPLSMSRNHFVCAAATQGLCTSPYFGISVPESDIPISRYTTSAVAVLSDFQASWNQAITTPANDGGTSQPGSVNLAELMVMTAIANNFILQLGALQGRLNHKEYNLPSTFIDMSGYAVGTYYLYLTDTGTGGIQVQVDAAQRTESATNMYFGKFDRTTSGFANESSVSEVVRFGTARLVAGSSGVAMQGSQIRVGPYVG